MTFNDLTYSLKSLGFGSTGVELFSDIAVFIFRDGDIHAEYVSSKRAGVVMSCTTDYKLNFEKEV